MAYKNLTSQQEAEILKNLTNDGLGSLKDELKHNFFTEIGQSISDQFASVVDKETGETSGVLKQSMGAIPSPDGFEIEGEFYYKFIDEGVNAAPSVAGLDYIKNRVSGSQYSFKNLGVGSDFAKSIRQNYGYSMSDAYGVAVGIKKYGIKAKNITDKVITDSFLNEVSEDISTILGLSVEVMFNKATE